MNLRARVLFGVVAAACVVWLPTAPREAAATGASARYVSGGAAVVRAGGEPVVDEGTVVCDSGDGIGAGGVCLPFGGGDAIEVIDDVMGENVAFQVCVDNSGDGVCTSPDNSTFCADQVVFSHDDAGNFFNPVGPVPTGFEPGCVGGPWKGYVVLLCEGAHVASDVHAHPAGSGTATVTGGGEGLGTFCGGGPQPSRKPYTVGSGARYMSGGTAAARNNGETVVDEGSMTCNNGDNTGVGGFCVSFGGGDAVAVYDAALGTDVAYQVCIDNSGDGVCTSPDNSPFCADQVFFSHGDDGSFYNPVGPLPTGFRPGCGGGAPWQGYVVFLCDGAHVTGADAHAHPATTGTGRVLSGGEGLGTFCGGSHDLPSRKRYVFKAEFPEGPDVQVIDFIAANGDRCQLLAARNDAATGQNFEGVVRSRPVTAAELGGSPTSPVTVRCFVKVNGSEVSSSAVSSGVGFAGPAIGRIAFAAGDTDAIQVCFEGTVDTGPVDECEETSFVKAPPQAVQDMADAAEDTARSTTDPLLCPLLNALAPGVPGVLGINSEGDLVVAGTVYKDCPPYAV